VRRRVQEMLFLSAMLFLLTITNSVASTPDTEGVFAKHEEPTRHFSHFQLLDEAEVQTDQLIYSSTSDVHLLEQRIITDVQHRRLTNFHTKTLSDIHENIMWAIDFHAKIYGKLRTAGYVFGYLGSGVIGVAAFFTSCNTDDWILRGGVITVSFGLSLMYLASQSEQSYRKNMDEVTGEIGRMQHRQMLQDQAVQKRREVGRWLAPQDERELTRTLQDRHADRTKKKTCGSLRDGLSSTWRSVCNLFGRTTETDDDDPLQEVHEMKATPVTVVIEPNSTIMRHSQSEPEKEDL
jgi:hypothetical protein